MFLNENEVKLNTENDISVAANDYGLGDSTIHYGEYFSKSSFDIEGELTGDTQEEIKNQTTVDDSIHESVFNYLEDDDLTVDDEVTGDTQEEIEDQTTLDDSIHESISNYLEDDNLTVNDEVTGDTQEEIEDQTTSDDSIHECGDGSCDNCDDKDSAKGGIKLDESAVRVFPRENINVVTLSDLNAVRRYHKGISLEEAVELVAEAHSIDTDSIRISK